MAENQIENVNTIKASRLTLDDIYLDQINTREHDERNLSTIAGSLKQFGSGRSIVIDGEDIVRAGNGTIEAARRLGMKKLIIIEPDYDEIVAVKRSDWSSIEANGYSIVDNKTTDLSRFNMEMLGKRLELLKQNGIPNTVVGWTDEEMSIFLEKKEDEAENEEGNNGDDGEGLAKIAEVIRAEPTTKSKRGDCFLLGTHLLFCVDVLIGWPMYMPSLKDGDVFVPYPSPLVPLGMTKLGNRYIMIQPNLYLCSMTVDVWNAANPDDKACLVKEIKGES